jgi:ribonuclease P protein component
MRGDRFLTKPREYERVYRQGLSRASRYLVLKAAPNDLDVSRYGISISHRVGNAVTRNRIKRRLREMLRLMVIRPGWDMVFIARTTASASTYSQLVKEVESLLKNVLC